jgi:hypothetical protein
MEWFWKNFVTGIAAAIVGGAILTAVTQHGGWSWHEFTVSGIGSGVAVAGWRILGTLKILMIVGLAVLAFVIGAIVASILLPLLLM